MSSISNLIKGVLNGGKIAEVVAGAVDNLTLSKEEKEQFKIDMQRIALEHEANQLKELEVVLKDTDSARQMQIAALNQDDKFSKRFLYYFTIHWSVFAVAYLVGITFFTIPQDNIRIVDTILGFMLGTAMAGMFSYFYGSSMGSRKRSDEITNAVTSQLRK